MPQMQNRVQETTTTGGTGTLTLAGAVTGYLTFAAGFSTGASLFYTIDNGVGEWEIGIGTLVTTGTLSRVTVIASSNGGALVNFGSGTKRVFCSAPTRSLVPDQDSKSGYVLTTDGTDPAWTQTLNGITIGNLTAAGGAFTTLSASSTVSGTGFSTYLASPPAIGGTTPAAGAFTTLSSSSTTTLNGTSIPASKTLVTLTDTQTLTNKTLTTPVISSISNTGTLTLPTSTDTLVGRATTDTLTGKTISGAGNTLSNIGNASLSNSSITFGATAQALGSTVSALNAVSIGQSTAAAGSFTTLSASSTVSGTGFSTYLASPPAIGGTTPAAGSFTTLGATGNTTLGDASGDTVAIRAGTAALPTLIPAGDTNTGLWFPAADTIAASTAGTERLRINSSGNVGIGTSSPTTSLHVYRAAADAVGTFQGLQTESGGTGKSAIQLDVDGKGGFAISNDASSGTKALTFSSNNGYGASTVEAMRIDSSGNLLLRQSSNSANTSVSFNTTIQNALTLDASGNLLVATTTKNSGAKVTVSDSIGLQNAGARTVERVFGESSPRSSIIVDITGGIDGTSFYVEIKMSAYFGFYANYSYTVYKTNSWTSYAPSVVNSQLSTSPALTVTPDLATAGRLRFTLAGTNITASTTLVKVICTSTSDPVIAVSYT